ncbi:MAG: DUF5522 domain-containing protein [Tepidisphaeraceae bacterium]
MRTAPQTSPRGPVFYPRTTRFMAPTQPANPELTAPVGSPEPVSGGAEGDDGYFENGRWVFSAAHHLRRGFCCQNRCRHCPYRPADSEIA